MKRNWKIVLWITIPAILFGAAGMILLAWYCHRAVIACRNFCYGDIGSVPEMETALLL